MTRPNVAPPARFELALPPPECGALSPELRGPAKSASCGLDKGRKQCTSAPAAPTPLLSPAHEYLKYLTALSL